MSFFSREDGYYAITLTRLRFARLSPPPPRFHQVYGWMLGHTQHIERMDGLEPSIKTRLPKHCKTYKYLRDKNRVKSMSAQQKKRYMLKKEEEAEEREARRQAEQHPRRGMRQYEPSADPDQLNQGPMKFKAATIDFSVTGLREARMFNVGDVTDSTKKSQYVEKRRREAQEARETRRRDGGVGANNENQQSNVVYVENYPVYDSTRRDLFRDENDNAALWAGEKLRGTSRGGSGMGASNRPSSAGVGGTGRAGRSGRTGRTGGMGRSKKANTHSAFSHRGGDRNEEKKKPLLNTVEGIMRGGRAVQHRYNGGGSGGCDAERRVWRDGGGNEDSNRQTYGSGGGGRGNDSSGGIVWRDFRKPGSLLIF